MIVIENVLKEVFSYLPEMSYSKNSTPYKPVFKYGDTVELAEFIRQAAEKGYETYPLIWLLYPYRENHVKRGRGVVIEDLTLILAVNTSAAMLNDERLATTFEKVLNPLYENVHKVMTRAASLNVDPETEIVKFPNYSGDLSNGEQNFTIDRWDAIKTIWNVYVNDKCLRKIII